MSNNVYPVLPGLGFSVVRAPIWNTVRKTSANGREYRVSNYQIPRYKYTLTYEFMRSASAYAELQTFMGFFNRLSGGWDTFLFQDPDDGSVGSGNLVFANTTLSNWVTYYQGATITTNQPDPYGGSNAVRLDIPTPATSGTSGGAICLAPQPATLLYTSVWLQLVPGSIGNVVYWGIEDNASSTAVLTTQWQLFSFTYNNTTNGLTEGRIFQIHGGSDVPTSFNMYAPTTSTQPIGPTVNTSLSAGGGQVFGVGDGTTKTFQLVRDFGGFVEPVYAPGVITALTNGGTTQYGYPRTNYQTYSSIVTTTYWTAASSTLTGGQTDPNGGTTATLLVEDTTNNPHGVAALSLPGNSSGTTWTGSWYVKPNGRNQCTAWLDNGAGTGVTVYFDLGLVTSTVMRTNANVVNLSSSVVAVANGWFRISITGTFGAAIVGIQMRIYLAGSLPFAASDGYGDQVYTGSGTLGLLIAWPQLEKSVVATSYIPTTAAAVTVTDYTLNTANGQVTFTNAPVSGAQLAWSGTFYWRCTFDDDTFDFEKFVNQIWEVKKISFTTVKP